MFLQFVFHHVLSVSGFWLCLRRTFLSQIIAVSTAFSVVSAPLFTSSTSRRPFQRPLASSPSRRCDKPLISASTHVVADARRTRKLLLHKHEINRLIGKVERDGYTLIPLALYWKNGRVKLDLALAKGKQSHDKRQAEKDCDWAREKQRTMRAHNPPG